MSDEQRDRIVDALLDEFLGGEHAPDLKQRILRAHQQQATERAVEIRVGRASSNGNRSDGRLPSITPLVPNRSRARALRRRYLNLAGSVAIVLIAVASFAIWALHLREQQRLANLPPRTTLQRPAEVDPVREDQADRLVDAQLPVSTPTTIPSKPAIKVDPTAANETVSVEQDAPLPGPFQRSVARQPPSPSHRIVDFIDSRLARSWERHAISPTGQVPQLVWLRRVTQFLVGRAPTREEQEAFASHREPEEAVETLLSSSDFSEHWANEMATTLVGAVNQARSPGNRQQLQDYLQQGIRDGKGYDQLAYELISAVGSNHPQDPSFNPATNFLLAYQAAEDVGGRRRPWKKTVATDKVGQVFLGKQLQCAKCHDHLEGGLAQDQYYQLAAFFTQMRSNPARDQARRLRNGDFAGSDGTFRDADLFFTRADDVGVSVYPKFLDGQRLSSNSGKLSEVDRRTALAQMIVRSKSFSSAFINRLWGRAFGTGFTRPVDDMGAHNPPSHPDLLDRLAQEFVNAQFELKAPMRWIALSSTFERRVRAPSDRFANRQDLFSSYARDDNLYHANIGPTLARIARARTKTGDQFDRTELLANLDSSKPISPRRRQREMRRINSRLREKLLRATDDSMVSRVARSTELTDAQRVAHMFMATVGRRPRPGELKHALQMLNHGSTLSALQDLGWVLLNSQEFVTQH